MPIFLPPISRRGFLTRAALATAGLAGSRLFAQTPGSDPDRFVLLSDLHIDADPALASRGANMTENLRQACAEIVALTPKPSGLLFTGDLAYNQGRPGDYAQFQRLIEPMREAGLPICLALGNHDQRENFRAALGQAQPPEAVVADREVALIRSRFANLFVLDSLHKTNFTPGVCGPAQLKWLAEQLDANPEKPAITFIHHNFNGAKGKPAGLEDSQELLELLVSRRQVKAHFFGHTHQWSQVEHQGLHLINLPPTAYVFAPGRPSGWVNLQLRKDGADLELNALDPKHPEHRQPIALNWRA